MGTSRTWKNEQTGRGRGNGCRKQRRKTEQGKKERCKRVKGCVQQKMTNDTQPLIPLSYSGFGKKKLKGLWAEDEGARIGDQTSRESVKQQQCLSKNTGKMEGGRRNRGRKQQNMGIKTRKCKSYCGKSKGMNRKKKGRKANKKTSVRRGGII